MTPNMIALRDQMNALIDTLNEGMKNLFAEANTHKANLIALLAAIAANKQEINDFAAIIEDTASLMGGIVETCDEVADKIADVEDNFDFLPTTPYEKFVTFCDDCGEEISADSNFERDGELYFCETCCAVGEGETVDEDEDESENEDNSEFVPLAESVE